MRSWSSARLASVLAFVLLAGAAVPAQAQYFRFGKNRVQYGGERWHYVQSTHFDVYYYEGGYHLADFTAKAAEAAYAQISDLFQHEIADRIPLLVYQSHNDFAVTNAVELPTYSEGIGGVTELFKNRIAIPFTGDYRDYRRVVHHELVHAVINDMFYGGSIQSIIQNNIRLHIPLWFNEGLAEYAALGWDTQSDMYVREAVLEDNLAPIEYLNGYFAYRGGQSVWDYVAEQYGREKVAEILQRLRMTRSVEAAFKRATGLDLDDLSERWHRHLKEIHYPELAAREPLDDVAKPVATREDGYYNTSPAISPQGDKVVFVTTKGALFDVYLAETADGKVIRKLIDGQDNTQFESLRILSPGLTWSPDGEKIALAVKSGPSDAIAVVDVETGRTMHYRVPGVDQILAVAWSPDGTRIAFEGSMDAQSDVYVLDLDARTTTNYTNDIFSDHEPAWMPDGSGLVFHSDRGAYTALGRHQPDTFPMVEHDYGQHDLYLLRLAADGAAPATAERLTTDALWDDHSGRFGSDPDRLLFISDRNGIPNLYEKNLATGVERPLTDLVVGVTQVSLSADGRKAAVVALKEGTPSIYVVRNPFDRDLGAGPLVPNVWAQRAVPETLQPAPAIALANERASQNPFLRDATDGTAYERRRAQTPEELLAARTPLLPELESLLEEIEAERQARREAEADEEAAGSASTDSSAAGYGGVRVDFRNYVFGEAFDEGRRERRGDAAQEDDYDPFADRFAPRDNYDEATGTYKPKKYKLTFSPDLVYGTAGYDVLYGVQGVTQMMFSDVLGNHQVFVATNLLIDLRNSDYVVAYTYLPNRTDWTLQGFHVSRLLPDYVPEADRFTYYRYRQFGAGMAVRYPFDKFHRVDLDLSVVGVNQTDIGDPTVPALQRALFHPSVTLTKDVSTPGLLYPTGGRRMALRVSGSPFGLDGGSTRFLTILGDARAYASFGRGLYSFALRTSAGTSVGPDQQLFYTSGVQNWINREFDAENGFPIDDVSDFIFATPVLPLRGSAINSQNGSHFGLVNAEFRFPLVAAVLPGPLPILPLYNLQGAAFVDAGSVWGGRSIDRRFNAFRENAAGERVFDDVIVGAGVGLRTILLGYPLRLDWAWPHDGQRFGRHQFYVSIGLDF